MRNLAKKDLLDSIIEEANKKNDKDKNVVPGGQHKWEPTEEDLELESEKPISEDDVINYNKEERKNKYNPWGKSKKLAGTKERQAKFAVDDVNGFGPKEYLKKLGMTESKRSLAMRNTKKINEALRWIEKDLGRRASAASVLREEQMSRVDKNNKPVPFIDEQTDLESWVEDEDAANKLVDIFNKQQFAAFAFESKQPVGNLKWTVRYNPYIKPDAWDRDTA